MIHDHSDFDPALIAQDEQLDHEDPLRHLMHAHPDDQLVPARHSSSSSDNLLSALPHQSYSLAHGHLQLSFASQPPLTVTLAVDASPGCGGVAWPAGQILAAYLVQKGSGFVQDKNIIELGSGTGLVGLVAGLLGGRVWITDQASLIPIMRNNVDINALSSRVAVAELNWGEPASEDIPRPHMILAADCVYFEPAFPLLVQTLDVLSSSSTEILFCYKKRRKADKRFFSLLKKKFLWSEVSDDPNHSIYSREAISLLRLTKK